MPISAAPRLPRASARVTILGGVLFDPVSGGPQMFEFRHFEVRQFDGFTELYLVDTSFFDVPRYAELQDELLVFVEMYRPRQLVVNFGRIKYCSTALISGVLQSRRRLDTIGGELKFCGMCQPVRDAFIMLNLDGAVFDIYESESDALAAF